jgi:hypothetical protein
MEQVGHMSNMDVVSKNFLPSSVRTLPFIRCDAHVKYASNEQRCALMLDRSETRICNKLRPRMSKVDACPIRPAFSLHPCGVKKTTI